MATKTRFEVFRRGYYEIRNSPFVYSRFINWSQRLSKVHTNTTRQPSLKDKVLRELKSEGIAVINFEELFPVNDFDNLSKWIESNESNLIQKSKKNTFSHIMELKILCVQSTLKTPLLDFT
jgi:hypothetical protein